MSIRIIPRLDIKGPNLVKGIHLEGLRVLGKPEQFAKYYYEHGADELIYMDVVASLYQRNTLHDIVSETAQNIFIPLTVGGGIRSLSDIQSVLRSGADKVSINTAAVERPDLIKEAANAFGSSTIVVSIEAIRHSDGNYEAYTDNGREATGLDVFEWARQVSDLGCGEILITSIDREGTGSGFDIELVSRVSEIVQTPVIACGGAGTKKDIFEAVKFGQANAVSLSSLLHYGYLRDNDTDIPKNGNTEYLKTKRQFTMVDPISLEEINNYLKEKGYPREYTLPNYHD